MQKSTHPVNLDMTGVWAVPDALVPPTRQPIALPALWLYEDIRRRVMDSGELIRSQETDRSVLTLESLALRGPLCITNSLYTGLQLILLDEVTSAHRHTQSAFQLDVGRRGRLHGGRRRAHHCASRRLHHHVGPNGILVVPSRHSLCQRSGRCSKCWVCGASNACKGKYLSGAYMHYAVPIPQRSTLRISGCNERFPVNRILCLGRNYAAHVRGMGKGGRAITVTTALQHVHGHAIDLDMTRRDLQLEARDKGRSWAFGKTFALSASIGAIHRTQDIGHSCDAAINLTDDGKTPHASDIAKLDDLIMEVTAPIEASMP